MIYVLCTEIQPFVQRFITATSTIEEAIEESMKYTKRYSAEEAITEDIHRIEDRTYVKHRIGLTGLKINYVIKEYQ
jgi:hypothetical protein